MALPKLLQKLFQNGGAGAKLNESIMPFAYAKSVNGKYPDSVGNIEIPARNVGDEWHSFTGQIPVGGVPYCGQEVTRATYADLWVYAQNNGLVKTESEWQALNTSQNGNVPFYSDGDGSTTFRMPKIVSYIKGAASQSEAGTYTAEGLPDHRHSVTKYREMVDAGGSWDIRWTGTSTGSTGLASASNPIYGNSEHVTPETSVILFGVYAFGEITNVGALDADTLATGLATLEANTNAHIRVVETWSSGTSWYRKWSDGWIEQGGEVSSRTTNTSYTETLNTSFTSTNYTLVLLTKGISTWFDSNGTIYTAKTTTTFSWMTNTLAGATGVTGMSWYACGY